MAKLGDICTVVSGSTPKTTVPEYWNGNINWITPAEIDDSTIIIKSSQRKITPAGVKSCGLTSFPTGTVILSSRAPIGKTAIAGTEMYCNQGFKNLICGEQIYNKYLFWFLRNNTQYLQSLGRGATFKEISKAIVENIDIPLPPLPEQRHIAAVLDKVSELIALRKKQLALLDEMVKARFMEMFGDPVRNEKSYPVKHLSDVAEYWNGLTYKPEDVSEKGIIVLRSSNIQNFKLDYSDIVRVSCKISQKKYVQAHDILMCSRNGSAKLVGKVALIDNINEPMSFGAFMMIIRSNLYSYLHTYFQLPAFRLQITTGATTTINQITTNMLNKIALPVPDEESINQFADFVQQVDKSIATVQQGLDRLNLLKSALMQEYFG